MSMVAATIASSAALAPEPLHEHAVDLELVEREPTEVRERRPAGAEVVDGEPHAEPSSARSASAVASRSSSSALSDDLEAQRGGVDAGVAQRASDELGEVGPLQLAGRHVDRHGQRMLVAAEPSARATSHACASTHAPMGTMMPVSSATRRKSPGTTSPRTGCSQRSSASSATRSPVARSNSGWNSDAELVAVERAAQRALGEEARHGLGVHRLVEQLVARATASLGAVHRRVGVLQQARRRGRTTGR